MENDDCDCGRARDFDGNAQADPNWLGTENVLETPLPASLQREFEDLFDRDSIATLSTLESVLRKEFGLPGVDHNVLCTRSDPTAHWAVHDGEVSYFRCFFDAALLPALVATTVDIRTIDPQGNAIEAWAVGSGDPTIRPPSAVASFGIDPTEVDRSSATPTREEAYAAICPAVRGFEDRRTYEAWSRERGLITVGLPFSTCLEIARAVSPVDP